LQWVIAFACLAVTVILQAEVALLFIGAGMVGILCYGNLFRKAPDVKLQIAAVPLLVAPAVATSTTLTKLLLFFLKAGSLTFGSGLVIVPFLQQGLVEQYGWLDERQFLIAVAVGMISPGPVVITATFVGYLVAGFWGSLVATSASSFPRSFLFWSPRLCSRATVKIQTCKVLCVAPMARPSARSSALASCSAGLRLATG
jgi:chromate transporter